MVTKKSKLKISLTLVLAAYLTCGPAAMLVNGQKTSGADYDDPVTTIQSLANLLETLPFALFELDPTETLGVLDTDPMMMNAGMRGRDEDDDEDDDDDNSCPHHYPRMYVVDDDQNQCPDAPYQTIQEAVDAAGADGDTNDHDLIKVCPGTYVEQVKIDGPQYNNLHVFGRNSVDVNAPTASPNPNKEAIIQAPAVFAPGLARDRSIVLISAAQNVELRSFFITGPAANIWAGVFVAGNASSAEIRHNHITQIKDVSAFSQQGHGVAVGRGLEGETGSACVRHNLIDRYQKTGVLVDNLGTSAEVRQNEIMGLADPSDPVAQNGVQISRNARAEVRHNKISHNRFGSCNPCAPSAVDSIGILTQDENNTDPASCTGSCTPIASVNPSLLIVGHNKLYLNDVGIGLGRSTHRSLFEHNSPIGNVRVGLRAYGITRNGGSTVPESQKNSINYNHMWDNPLDCSDQTTGSGTPAPSANYWKKNKGKTEDTPGICKR